MPKITDLVSTLGSGWKTVGTGTPVEEVQTIPNPMASNPVAPAGTPSTITQGTGRYYVVVQDPEGHQRAMFLTPSSDQGVSGPGLTPTPSITGKADGSKEAPAAPGTRIVAGNELGNLNWDQAGAVADVPAGASKEPSATDKLDTIDSKGNVVPAGDPSAKQMRDPKTGTVYNLVTDPAGTVHDVGQEVWLIKPDGSHSVVGSVPEKATTQNVPGVGLVEYDPSKPAGSRATVVMPVPTDPNNLGGIQVRNGVSYVPTKDKDGKITFLEAQGLPADQSVDHYYDDPNSRYVQLLDKQGNVIKQIDKGADWKPPVRVQPGTAPAADSVNPFIQVFDPTTGDLKFVPNQNQVKASDATAEIAKQLGVKVAAGQMSEDAAQKLITSAINVQNSQSQKIQAQAAQTTAETGQQSQIATAAGDVLRNAASNAQTGAGLLQNRVTTATGALNSLVSSAAGSKMTSIPGGVGEGLVNGLQDWVTGLGGGKDVYDTAARMVQAADPKISSDPTLANQAQQTLGNMLALYQQQTGQPHPAVAATQAANASAQGGGVTAPVTQPAPTPVVDQQALMQRQQADAALQRQQAALVRPPVPVQPAGQAPGFVAPISTVPGANYGAATAYTGGVAPWLAQPQPSFIAPMIPT